MAESLVQTASTYSQDSDDITGNTNYYAQKIDNISDPDLKKLTNITWYWKFANKNEYEWDDLNVGIMNDPLPANPDVSHYIDYSKFDWSQAFPAGATLYTTALHGENGTDGINVTFGGSYWLVLIDSNGHNPSAKANWPLGADPGIEYLRLLHNAGGTWSADASEYGKNLSYSLYGDTYNTTTTGAANVEETTADLVGWLNSTCGVSVTMGFWLGNASQTLTTIEQNITLGSAVTGNNSHSLTGLNHSHYYYYRPWILSSYGFKTSSEEGTFLTKPMAPGNLTATFHNATNITLAWDNVTGSGPLEAQNQTTVIVYSQTDYPITADGGTVGYNGTDEGCTIEGLSAVTKYYFSAFSYINDSGSPFYWWYSDLFGMTTNTTAGNNYTVFIRWECNNSVINLNDGNAHFYTLEKADGTVLNSSFIAEADGEWNITALEDAQVFTFLYNNTIFRSTLIDPTDTNITIWIPCGDIGTDVGDITPVTIFFIDFSGALTPENQALGYLYRYQNGTTQYMYMGYLQADLAIRTFLTIGTTYYVGVGCSVFTQHNLGPITVYEDEYTVNVFYNESINHSYLQLLDIAYGWSGTTLYFDLEDTTHIGGEGVINSTVYLYSLFNNTLVDTEYQPVPWNYNYTIAGLNTSWGYRLKANITYSTPEENWTTYIFRVYLPWSQDVIIDDTDYIESVLNQTLGDTPLQHDGDRVGWAAIIGMGIVTFFVFLFSPKYIGFGIMGTGIILAFLKTPLNLLSDAVFPWGAIGLVIVIGFLAFILMRKED